MGQKQGIFIHKVILPLLRRASVGGFVASKVGWIISMRLAFRYFPFGRLELSEIVNFWHDYATLSEEAIR